MAQSNSESKNEKEAGDLLQSIEEVVSGLKSRALRTFNSSATLPSVVKEITDFLDRDATAEDAVKSIDRIKPRTLRKDEIISTLGVRG